MHFDFINEVVREGCLLAMNNKICNTKWPAICWIACYSIECFGKRANVLLDKSERATTRCLYPHTLACLALAQIRKFACNRSDICNIVYIYIFCMTSN